MFTAGHASGGPVANEAGKILFKTVVGFVLGKGFDSIFGGNSLTAQDVADAVEKGKIDLETDMANESYSELIYAMRNYHTDDDMDTRKNRLDEVLEHAGEVRAKMEGVMSQRFWQVMKPYTEVRSYEFAFLAESAAINHSRDTLTQLGDEAAEAMRYVYHAFEHFYADGTRRDCVKKKSEQTFYNTKGESLPADFKVGKTEFDLHKYLCRDKYGDLVGLGAVLYTWKSVPHKDLLGSTGVFQRPGHNEWYFTLPYFKNHKRNPYHLHGPYNSREDADHRRIQLAGKEYPRELGRVRKLMYTWYQIADAHASGEKKKLAAEYRDKWDTNG